MCGGDLEPRSLKATAPTRLGCTRCGFGFYPAPKAAGVIHSDFERGFICAETLSYADFTKCGTWQAAKEKGVVRTEGKEYVMHDANIVHFLFNV